LPRHYRDCGANFFKTKLLWEMRPGVLPMTPKQSDFWIGWCDIPSAEETEIPKVQHQDQVDFFSGSEGIVHKEFVPEEKQ
jgi:hypothetical protein